MASGKKFHVTRGKSGYWPLKDPQLTGSVTERLSARLDEIEPVVGRMLKNEAKLIADALRFARDVAVLQTDVLALSRKVERLTDDRHALRTSLLTRLRWLVTGR